MTRTGRSRKIKSSRALGLRRRALRLRDRPRFRAVAELYIPASPAPALWLRLGVLHYLVTAHSPSPLRIEQ